MFCTNCGAQIPEGKNVCPKCGYVKPKVRGDADEREIPALAYGPMNKPAAQAPVSVFSETADDSDDIVEEAEMMSADSHERLMLTKTGIYGCNDRYSLIQLSCNEILNVTVQIESSRLKAPGALCRMLIIEDIRNNNYVFNDIKDLTGIRERILKYRNEYLQEHYDSVRPFVKGDESISVSGETLMCTIGSNQYAYALRDVTPKTNPYIANAIAIVPHNGVPHTFKNFTTEETKEIENYINLLKAQPEPPKKPKLRYYKAMDSRVVGRLQYHVEKGHIREKLTVPRMRVVSACAKRAMRVNGLYKVNVSRAMESLKSKRINTRARQIKLEGKNGYELYSKRIKQSMLVPLIVCILCFALAAAAAVGLISVSGAPVWLVILSIVFIGVFAASVIYAVKAWLDVKTRLSALKTISENEQIYADDEKIYGKNVDGTFTLLYSQILKASVKEMPIERLGINCRVLVIEDMGNELKLCTIENADTFAAFINSIVQPKSDYKVCPNCKQTLSRGSTVCIYCNAEV